MNVTGRTRIFRKDFNGRASYSRMIASKEFKDGRQTDSWIRTYEPVQMPKGTDRVDGTVIDVKNGFEAAYRMQNGSVGRKLVVTSYKIQGETVRGIQASEPDAIEAAGFYIDDSDIPF